MGDDVDAVGEYGVLLVALKVLTVLAGFFIVYLGLRAFRAQRQKSILWLAVGMAILALGAVAEGLVFQGLGLDLPQSHLLETVVTLLGFMVLIVSLYAR